MSDLNEAQARIKINQLLQEAGWRFSDNSTGKANIKTEQKVDYRDCASHCENNTYGLIDYLLLDEDGRALVVIEAKRERIDPLSAKEQARRYAHEVGARFIILSNGDLHYFWDIKSGNPWRITRYPSQQSLTQCKRYAPNPTELVQIDVDENYIVASQMPKFANDPEFKDELKRNTYLKKNNLKQLRPYQVQAIKALQESVKNGSQRFLFEMATGTGKTLVAAAAIKLFLKSGNAMRVLFLVDRLELEEQAQKAFSQYLGKDFSCVIFKDCRDLWQNASIVISTIQTLLAGDKYKRIFSPTDFQFTISDEAHRTIGGAGDSRAVFEYFGGYKLGLTATPKNYLKGVDIHNLDNVQDYERRKLLDTYKTFGCESGNPTFSYDLIKGAKENFLIQPTVVDARTEVTTKLLSDKGYAVHMRMPQGDAIDEVYNARDYERTLFNEETNVAMCKAFLDNGFYDPVAQKCQVPLFGKSIVFCVSQRHAARVTNILNTLASKKWPQLYNNSDFAMQVTSQISTAQQMTLNFTNNCLGGRARCLEDYETSKTRVVVTVGMMTTGYDCPDLLNIALMRPVFSPSDFVQIKGRGTRKWVFEYNDFQSDEPIVIPKEHFKFFDFFATCEYFEHEYQYDEKIKLPQIKNYCQAELPLDQELASEFVDENDNKGCKVPIDIKESDKLSSLTEKIIGAEGMRIDRESYKHAVQEDILGNTELVTLWKNGDCEAAVDLTEKTIINKPKHFLTLDKIRQIFNLSCDPKNIAWLPHKPK